MKLRGHVVSAKQGGEQIFFTFVLERCPFLTSTAKTIVVDLDNWKMLNNYY